MTKAKFTPVTTPATVTTPTPGSTFVDDYGYKCTSVELTNGDLAVIREPRLGDARKAEIEMQVMEAKHGFSFKPESISATIPILNQVIVSVGTYSAKRTERGLTSKPALDADYLDALSINDVERLGNALMFFRSPNNPE